MWVEVRGASTRTPPSDSAAAFELKLESSVQRGLLLKELVEANRTYDRRPQIVFIAEKEIFAAALVLNALLQERRRLQFAELVTGVEYMVIGEVGQKIGAL